MAAPTKHALRAAGLPTIASASHIVPLMEGDAGRRKATNDLLLACHAIYFQSINYPTVPVWTERPRITPTPGHTETHVAELVETLVDVRRTLGMPFVETKSAAPSGKADAGGVLPYPELKRAAKYRRELVTNSGLALRAIGRDSREVFLSYVAQTDIGESFVDPSACDPALHKAARSGPNTFGQIPATFCEATGQATQAD